MRFLLSKELDVLCGVLQVSMLGPILFNIYIYIYIYIHDLVFVDVSDMSSDIGNYVDYISPYKCAPCYDKCH